MTTENSVFEKTYSDYLNQIRACDLNRVSNRLGLQLVNNELIVQLLDETYSVSGEGIYNEEGQRPGFERCVIISKYILLCPEVLPEKFDWTTFRGLNNSGPLEVYFRNEAEHLISRYFTGKTEQIKKASEKLGGSAPEMKLNYDFVSEILLLSKLPVIIAFNDEDEEFPAACSILFEKHVESFLDAESLAILGHVFAEKLKTLSS